MKPARDVAPGTSRAFTDHRTMAEVFADEISRLAATPIDPVPYLNSGSFFRRKLAEAETEPRLMMAA